MSAAGAQGPLEQIEAALESWCGGLDLPGNLKDAIAYALLGGGKRVRPILCWRACEAAGAPGQASLPAGIALELIHAFSLVHDDLPALDNDDLRRGRPTLHRHAGEAMAILAGDAMLTLAFGVVAQRQEPRLASALLAELSAATTAMIVGQVYDTLGGLPAGLAGRERLETIHRRKTGALIRAACRMGGLSAGADAARLEALTAYGEALGLMFQITDDLLDAEGTPEETGKRTGKDAAAGKVTYPMVLGVAGARAEVERLRGVCEGAAAVLGPRGEPLTETARLIAVRRS